MIDSSSLIFDLKHPFTYLLLKPFHCHCKPCEPQGICCGGGGPADSGDRAVCPPQQTTRAVHVRLIRHLNRRKHHQREHGRIVHVLGDGRQLLGLNHLVEATRHDEARPGRRRQIQEAPTRAIDKDIISTQIPTLCMACESEAVRTWVSTHGQWQEGLAKNFKQQIPLSWISTK